MRSLAIAALIAGSMPGSVSRAEPSAEPLNVTISGADWIPQAIRDLAADDPNVRDAASHRLAAGGIAARPAVLAALRKPACPEVRARAASILIQLPWARPDDAPTARQLMGEYNQRSPELRVRLINRLAEAHNAGGREALLRLLREEPNITVRWAIVAQCRQLRDEELLHELRQSKPDDDAPALVAAAYAWQQRDPEKMASLMRRAVELEWLSPSDDLPTTGDPTESRGTDPRGEVDRVFDILYARSMTRGQFDEAAALLRALSWRHLAAPDDEEGLPMPLLNLFALHAQYGPLAGFDQDCRAFADYLGEPELIYAVGRMHLRHGEALLADVCYRAAASASLSRQLTHKRVAEFLLRRGWYDLAEKEYFAVLACTGPDKEVHDADAYVGLSRAASGLGDDRQAADRLRTAMDLAHALPGRTIRDEPAFRAEISWHDLRAAMEKDDRAEIERHVLALSQGPTINTETNLDLVAALKRLGHPDEAARIFDPLYAELERARQIDPHNAEVLNNLAWTSARTGEHIEQAVAWAAEAVAAAPGNPAYLDTAAEANFVAGHRQAAVQFETQALQLQPGDRFMMKQLKRFQEAPLPVPRD